MKKHHKALEVLKTLEAIELESPIHVSIVLSDAHGLIFPLSEIKMLIKKAKNEVCLLGEWL